MVGLLTLHLHLPGVASLKEKRSRIKPLLSRLHRQFNLASAEMDRQDMWQEAVIACAMLGNDSTQLQSALETVRKWVLKNWPDGEVIDTKFEII
jgi:hypothetical protein